MAGMEGGGTLSEVYQSARKLLLRARDGVERLERFESSVSGTDSPELSFAVKKDISQIHSLCADMDRLWRSIPAKSQRDLWKRKVEQVAEEADSLKDSLDKYSMRNQRRMLEAKERAELLGRANGESAHVLRIFDEEAQATLKKPISMATFSPPPLPTSFSVRPNLTHNSTLSLPFKRPFLLLSTIPKSLPDNGAGVSASVAAVEDPASNQIENAVEASAGSNGAAMTTSAANAEVLSKFEDPRWIGGTWDLQQFAKDGTPDWDAVIDAEVRRRKWLQDNPETTSNEDPVVFDTSIIPWWAWMKRFHLPEAELLNGRAAMIGFFMAYLVDSLTGVGLVDQMGNFFSKTLLFVAVVGVLLIRKNEDLDNIKKLIEETTFYDKQWQATWQDDNNGSNST